jgi:membrane-bound lytic murein transglycosylase D
VNGISNRGNISTGQTLLVPLNGEETENAFEAFNMNLAADDRSHSVRHKVRRGETLSGIALRYHVSVAKLRQWNGPMKILRIGQTIAIAQTGIRKTSVHRRKSSDHSPNVAQNGASKNSLSQGI